MKAFLSTLIILFFAISIHAQDNPIYQGKTILYKDFKINGLLFIAAKGDIIKQFGKPQRLFEPKYECGFLSEDVQEKKFYTLKYKHILFTGNETVRYQLEEIKFDPEADLKVTYKRKPLSHLTTKKDFEKILKVKIDEDEVTLIHKDADDSLIFYFLNGRLSRMEYWSPC